MGGGGRTHTETIQTDPRIVSAYLDNLNRTRSMAGNIGQREFAAPSPLFQAGSEMLGQTLGFQAPTFDPTPVQTGSVGKGGARPASPTAQMRSGGVGKGGARVPQATTPRMPQIATPGTPTGGTGMATTNQAAQALTGLLGMQPQQISPMSAVESMPGMYGGAQVGSAAMMDPTRIGPAATMQAAGQVGDISAPGMIDVNQLSQTDLNPYMNPYQQAVIDLGQQDIERQRQMASAAMGARAQAAGAFGGSRQAVQEGVLGGEAARAAAQLSAQQRQAGFESAQRAAQFDIGNVQQARAMASQMEMQANQLNQQAAESAAQREQAARAGNMEAANVFAAQQAAFEQQAAQTNQQAQNAMQTLQAQLDQQAGLAGQSTMAELVQADQRARMQADMANLESQFRAAGLDQQTARQLADLGAQQQRMGLEGSQAMLNLGLLQQQMTQEQLDAIRNLPIEQQRIINEALGLYPPGGGGTSQSSARESANILGPIAQGVGAYFGATSDRRLKENIVLLGNEPKTGLPWYEFSYLGDKRRFEGVMADDVEKVYPEAVTVMENGYKGVYYGALGLEMREVSQ